MKGALSYIPPQAQILDFLFSLSGRNFVKIVKAFSRTFKIKNNNLIKNLIFEFKKFKFRHRDLSEGKFIYEIDFLSIGHLSVHGVSSIFQI